MEKTLEKMVIKMNSSRKKQMNNSWGLPSPTASIWSQRIRDYHLELIKVVGILKAEAVN
ncbi:hypothetical protein IC575_012578 [Cucumis melo]